MNMVSAPDPADVIQQACRLLIAGWPEDAARLVSSIDERQLKGEWDEAFAHGRTARAKARTTTSTGKRTSWTTHAGSDAIYRRDHYTCRYCGKRTIHVRVLEAVSYALRNALRYGGQSWPFAYTHRLYWTHTTSLEHLVPVARGGAEHDPENFVTVCWVCNHAKGDLLESELGIESLAPASNGWTGLTSLLADLRNAIGYDPDREPEWKRYGTKPRTPMGGRTRASETKPARTQSSRGQATPSVFEVEEGIMRFHNADHEYKAWSKEHPAGLVVNESAVTSIHRSGCKHVLYPDGNSYTRKPKLCSTDRARLESYVKNNFSVQPRSCAWF